MIPEVIIDLSLPPDARWQPLRLHLADARQLFDLYQRDMGGLEPLREMAALYRQTQVTPEINAEVDAIAALTGVPAEAGLLVNLSYDVTKVLWGCTAFAVDTPDGPLHARNLDWWTENGLLSQKTLLINYRRGDRSCRVVGWPGFLGALSGLAPGRFAVTLNAVLSDEPAQMAPPITFLLRSVLTTAATYQDAVAMLTDAPIATDCLLLVTGTQPGEMAIIERTPTRAALRHPENGFLIVSNDYRALGVKPDMAAEQELQATSCGRFARVHSLLSYALPRSLRDCMDILRDPYVQMGITVQQMVMSPAQAILQVRLPLISTEARGD